MSLKKRAMCVWDATLAADEVKQMNYQHTYRAHVTPSAVICSKERCVYSPLAFLCCFSWIWTVLEPCTARQAVMMSANKLLALETQAVSLFLLLSSSRRTCLDSCTATLLSSFIIFSGALSLIPRLILGWLKCCKSAITSGCLPFEASSQKHVTCKKINGNFDQTQNH